MKTSTLLLACLLTLVFCPRLPAQSAAPAVPDLERPPVLAAQPGDKVTPSPDGACEVVVRGDTPRASADTEAFIRMGNGSGGAVGELAYTFRNLGRGAKVDAYWSPDSRYLALIVRHTKYHDLLLVGRGLLPVSATQVGVVFATVRAQLLPAGGILDKFPSTGKPAGRDLRLDTMSITRTEWSPDSRVLALQASLGLKDGPGTTVQNGPGYRYVVDYALTMPDHPPVMLPGGKGLDGGDAQLKLLNVAFLPVPER